MIGTHEKKGVTFNDVKNVVEVTPTKSKQQGTKIILTDLRSSWTKDKLSKLRKSITSIILPPEIQKIHGIPFEVHIHADEFGDEKKTRIDSVLFDIAPYKVKATIPNRGSRCTPTIWKKGKIVRQDPIDMYEYKTDDNDDWTSFGKCKVTLYFYPERSRYEKWNEYYKKALNVNRISGIIQDFRGVKLYRDGFWVRPYGEEGNDWLGLEESRVQSNLKIGNSRVIGFVEISKDDNPEIQDTTTRERLDENQAFQSMKTFVTAVVDELYHYRDDDYRRKREEETKVHHENVIESEIKYLEELVEEQNLPSPEKKVMKTSLKTIQKTFTDYQGDVGEDFERLEIAERAYRNLASLGISSAATSHEISNVINDLEEIPTTISNILDENDWHEDDLSEALEEAEEFISLIKHYTWFTRSFVQNLTDDASSEHEIQKVPLRSTIKSMIDTFTELTSDSYDVVPKYSPENISVWMNKADLLSIILNLLTNSLKSLTDLPEDKKKKIRISFYRDSRNFKIKFSDNGKGIRDSHKNKIFRLFFTTSPNGTGLGLPIIKEIVEEYDGKIELSASSELENGATFMITIPWEKVSK